MELKQNLFTLLFKVFLNKYFLPEVCSLEENMKLSQSQSTEGSKAGASIGQGEPSFDRVNRLIKEVTNFFAFLGCLAVEYYCLDRLAFSGWNDVGYRIKIDPCVYLTREVLADFFVFIFYEKYMSSNIVELLLRRNPSELESLSKKIHLLQDISATHLKIPLEAFPDYSMLQNLVNESMAAKQRRHLTGRLPSNNLATNSLEIAEPGAYSSSFNSDPKPAFTSYDLLESETIRIDKGEKNSVTSRVSNASSTANDKLKGDLLSRHDSSQHRASSLKNSAAKGLNIRQKLSRYDRSRLLLEDTKTFNTVLSDSGLAHKKVYQTPERSRKAGDSYSLSKQKAKSKTTKLLSTLEILTLNDQLTILDIISQRGVGQPFTSAVAIFKQIQFIETPIAKLECIYNCLSEAIRDIHDYYATVNRNLQNFFHLTRENLQSIFTYIVVKSRVSNLTLQLLTVREFVLSRGLVDIDRICGLLGGALDFIEEAEISL